MKLSDDPFMSLRDAATDTPSIPASLDPYQPRVCTAQFHGFGHNDELLVTGMAGLPYEIIRAESTVALRHQDVGSVVVVVLAEGDVRRPIIVGVVQDRHRMQDCSVDIGPNLTMQDDHDHLIVTAEREITLKCGDASITLTRAGKVIIRGTSIVSRSVGYNKIKGAVVEIN